MNRFKLKGKVLAIVLLPIATATMAGLAHVNSLDDQITVFLFTIVPFFPGGSGLFFRDGSRFNAPTAGCGCWLALRHGRWRWG